MASYGTMAEAGGEAGPSTGLGSRLVSSTPTRTRTRATSGASSMRTAGPILVSSSRPDELTRLINAQYHAHASSSALQETDLSVPPLGLDIQDNEPPDSFRRQTLLSLDVLRGLLLALLAGESIQMFLRSEEESDENWYSKQDRWTESPLYALRLAAVSDGTCCYLLKTHHKLISWIPQNPAAPGWWRRTRTFA